MSIPGCGLHVEFDIKGMRRKPTDGITNGPKEQGYKYTAHCSPAFLVKRCGNNAANPQCPIYRLLTNLTNALEVCV